MFKKSFYNILNYKMNKITKIRKINMNYLNEMPDEISRIIYNYCLLNIINSFEFKNKRQQIIFKYFIKTKSQKQLKQLGLKI